MKEFYELREFDIITYKDNSTNNDRFCVVSQRAYDELRTYIESFDESDEEDDARKFFKISNKGITAQNYVGLIQLKSGIRFQILPKLDLGQDDLENRKTKVILVDMLKALLNFSGKMFNQAGLRTEKTNLYEVFISMYIQQVEVLLKHGLKSAYDSVENNIPFFKGKLMISNHIKHNAVDKTKFYMMYDEFLLDRPENRLIKATLVKLLSLTRDNSNSRLISQQLVAFEDVNISVNYHKDFSKVNDGRNMNDYKRLIPWSMIILYDYSFTSFAGSVGAVSLLFPMEKLFEAYVAKKVKRYFEEVGWEVSTQDRQYYLFDNPRMFSLRPDIVLSDGLNNRIVVMDTKWKRLVDNIKMNYGIKQQDMYQMYAYSKKYHTKEIWLLYPLNYEMNKYKNISFSAYDESLGDNNLELTVRVFFVDIEKIDESIKSLLNEIIGE